MDLILAGAILLLTLVVFLPLFKNHRRNAYIHKCIDILPGAKWYPIVGSTGSIITVDRKDIWETLIKRHKIYGPMYRSWYGSSPAVQIYKPEHIQIILKSQTIIKKGAVYRFISPWLGQGLVTGSGDHWRHHRKVITPAFHFKILDKYQQIFSEQGKRLTDKLGEHVGKGYFNIEPYLAQVSLDIIAETAMGVKLNFLNNRQSEYGNAIIGFSLSIAKRLYNPLYRNDFFFKLSNFGKTVQKHLDKIEDFNKKIIDETRTKFQKNQSKYKQEDEYGRKEKMAFLDIMLSHQQENKFNDNDVLEEVNTFMFGGQDTTTSTVIYTLLALGNNPEIQKRVQQELDSVFGDDDRPVTVQDLPKLEYMDRVIKEALRYYTFIPTIWRTLEEDVVIDKVFIPKGVSIVMSLYDLHHDPEIYPEPYKFDPDRFLPEQVAQRHPFAYVPFSAGPRNCIGQKFGIRNAKTLLAHVLRKYNFKSLEKPEDVKFYIEIVLRPQNGLHFVVEPRS